MLSHTLIATDQDPTFIVGATCEQIGGGARTGRADLLIGEACEYDRSFLNFHPTHGVVLNLEEDHLDIYGSLDAIVEAFHEFAQRITPEGSLLIAHESAYRTAVAAGLSCKVESIGYAPQADWHIEILPSVNVPHQRVSITHLGEKVCEFDCQLPGEHMAYNASVAAVTAHRLGADWQGIGAALSDFRGLDRRMQNLGTVDGVTVVDDYGHHPTEIDTTLRALRNHHRPHENGGRLVCVFQPHQHSRTRFLLDQFATSFAAADVVIVPHIYFVRDSEADRKAVSAADLVAKLNDRDVTAYHIDSFDEILEHLRVDLHENDLLVVMGAGPVWQIGHRFVGREV
jgi:UDP-N-acetylmuramate--alanine ligase